MGSCNCLAPVWYLFPSIMRSPVDYGSRVEELRERMSEVRVKRDDVMRNIFAARREGMEPTDEVKWWLNRVDEMEGTLSMLEASVSDHDCGLGPDIFSRCSISKKASEMIALVDELKNKDLTLIDTGVAPDTLLERPAGRLIIGMEREQQQLQNYIDDDQVSIIGIYGMCGTGKTTLLDKLYHDFLEQGGHDAVLKIDMSNSFNMGDIQKVVTDKLGLSREEDEGKEEQAYRIYKFLSRRNFILILDDLQEPIDLEEIGIPIARSLSRSNIIFATEREDVCALMEAKMVKVDCLGWDDAWGLFVKTVGNEELIYSNPKIRRQIKVLVNSCGGLPLALVTMGRAMASKKTPQEWEDVVRTLEGKPWKISDMKERVLSVLQSSYQSLADETVKQWLLYCTLYPEVSATEKEWIIDHLIGEGKLDDDEFDYGYEMYNYGYHLFGILEASSWLERYEDENEVMMHPIVRAMALYIGVGMNKWLVRADKGLREAPEVEKWRGAERISLIGNKISELPEAPECPSLLTLMLQDNCELGKIPSKFFSFMPNLAVLDVSGTSIEKLPKTIRMLTGLRYLNVSNTRLRSLPEELRALEKLRCLLLSDTPDLEHIPDGLIGSLGELRILYMFFSYGDWKVGSSGDGIPLDELRKLTRLKALGITVESITCLQMLAQSPRLATSTRKLHIRGCPGLATLSSEALGRDHTDLRWLAISDCADLKEVVISGSSDEDYFERSSLPYLQDLNLQLLPTARIIWKGGYLANLRSLCLYGCDAMEQLIQCTDESITEKEDPPVCPFPNLKRLDLLCLQNFRSLRCGMRLLDFPSLEILTVEECPKLKKLLPLQARKLKEIIGTASWWDEIEWDGDDTKSMFLPLFKEL